MSDIANLSVTIDANTSGFKRAMAGVDRDLGATHSRMRKFDQQTSVTGAKTVGMGKRVGGSMMGMALAFGAPIAAVGLLGLAVKTGASEMADYAKNAANTQAALKSTGGVAKVTLDDINKLSDGIERQTGIDGDLIHAGSNMLLTFTKVHNEAGRGNDIFNRAMVAASDLSVRGFGSIESASKMLGKALQDPVKGLTAMGRAGVTFTAQQKETIKRLVETGHTLEAQKLIMKEVETQVGGSAVAFGQTLPGAVERAKRSLEGVAKSVAETLAPALATGLDGLMRFGQEFMQKKTLDAKIRFAIGTFQGLAWKGVQTLFDWWTTPKTQFEDSPGGRLKINIIPSGQDQVANFFSGLRKSMIKGAHDLGYNLGSEILRAFGGGARNEISGSKTNFLQILGAILNPQTYANLAFDMGLALVKGLIEPFYPGMRRLKARILGGISDAYNAALGKVGEWYSLGFNMIMGAVDGVKSAALQLVDAVTGAVGDAWDAARRAAHIQSPSKKFRDGVGLPIAQGIMVGFLDGSASLPQKMVDRIGAALDRAKARVDAGRQGVADAFARIADVAMRAFDAQMAKKRISALAPLQAQLDAIMPRADAAKDARVAAGGELTPAEKALADLQATHQRAADAQAKHDALMALQAARASGDLQEIANAQRAYDDILYQEKVARLTAQAVAERAAKDAQTQTDLARIDANAQAELARVQALYDDKQAQFDFDAELTRLKREQELARLLRHMQASNTTVKTKMKELHKFIRSPEMKDMMAAAGVSLGLAFGNALEGTAAQVKRKASKLAQAVAAIMQLHSPAKEGPMSTLDSWWTPLVPTLMKGIDTRALGGLVSGIAAPEFSADAALGATSGSSRGALIVNIHVEGSVTSENDLVNTIRNGLVRTGYREGSIFGGLA